MTGEKIHITLVDPKPELCEAWEVYFSDCHEVSIYNGYFETIEWRYASKRQQEIVYGGNLGNILTK